MSAATLAAPWDAPPRHRRGQIISKHTAPRRGRRHEQEIAPGNLRGATSNLPAPSTATFRRRAYLQYMMRHLSPRGVRTAHSRKAMPRADARFPEVPQPVAPVVPRAEQYQASAGVEATMERPPKTERPPTNANAIRFGSCSPPRISMQINIARSARTAHAQKKGKSRRRLATLSTPTAIGPRLKPSARLAPWRRARGAMLSRRPEIFGRAPFSRSRLDEEWAPKARQAALDPKCSLLGDRVPQLAGLAKGPQSTFAPNGGHC